MKLITLLAVTFLFQAVSGQNNNSSIVKKLPSISVYNIKGESFGLSTLGSGKVTVIDCWFLPCAPCFAEMPMLHDLYSKYKDNPNFQFLTLTRTDTSLVRPLIENQKTGNEIYQYFKTHSGLETFSLPVFFIPGCNEKLHNFNQSSVGFAGSNTPPENRNNCPDVIFGFTGFPTLMIFDKKGKLVYNVSGFSEKIEKQQLEEIEKIITSKL